MTEQGQLPDAERAASPRSPRRRLRRFAMPALMVALAAIFAGSLTTHAWSDRFFDHCGFMGGPTDPARAERRAAVFADRIADHADANAQQREKLVEIAKAAAKDIAPLRQKAHETRKMLVETLTQATVDRNRVEQLRTEQVAAMEAITKRLTQAVADAAEALSPEQRKKVAESMPQAGGPHGWRHHWGPWGRDGEGGDWGRERE
jgi:periplasmic protein CpxP/Spy